jgi:hypothetical protein
VESFGRAERYKVGEDCCVLAAADSFVFTSLQLMYYSLTLSHDVKVYVVDLGLRPDQRAWADRQPGLTVINLAACGPMLFGRAEVMWQTWNKPLYIEACPSQYVLWIDTDCLILDDLRPLFDRIRRGPLFVIDPAPPEVVYNQPGLYDVKPVRRRITHSLVNGGVCGFCPARDAKFLGDWKGCIKAARENHLVRNSLAWWDQGALNWALEYNDLRENILYDNRYCTGGDRRERKDVIDLLTNGINWNAAILHFCGRSKPWERWPGVWLVGQTADDDDLVGYKERLDVFVLSHSDAMLRASPKRTYLRPVNLDRLDIGRYQENHLAESRIFLSDVPDTGSEYVGFATARWDGKYHPPVSRLGHLGRLPLYPSTVYSPDVFGPNWAAHSDQHHPGMYKLLKEMAEVSGLRLEAGPTFYGQNFICHRSVYDDFIKVWRTLFDHFYQKYRYDLPFDVGRFERRRAAAYLYERFTCLYFANRTDLKIALARPSVLRL